LEFCRKFNKNICFNPSEHPNSALLQQKATRTRERAPRQVAKGIENNKYNKYDVLFINTIYLASAL
jgi:hypothetical protein